MRCIALLIMTTYGLNLTCNCYETEFYDPHNDYKPHEVPQNYSCIVDQKWQHLIDSKTCTQDSKYGSCIKEVIKFANTDEAQTVRFGCHYGGSNAMDLKCHHKDTQCCSISDELLERGYEECPEGGYRIDPEPETESDSELYLYIVGIVIGLAVLGVIILISKRAYSSWRHNDQPSAEEQPLYNRAEPRTVSTSLDTREGISSGRGPQVIVPRRIALEVQLVRVIGRGRFGRVNLGIWNGQEVACKIFDSRDENSWKRETNAYDINGIAHKHILNRISSDMRESGVAHEYWLITDYHQNGSLFEYLKSRTLTVLEALTLQHTAINGINHLHTYIQGTTSKIQIAHRDIKTKNILVNDHGESIIADLGLAVSYNPNTERIDLPKLDGLSNTNGIQVGTKRYMPPEILLYDPDSEQNDFNPSDFKSFINADTYSLGLVLWEIASRTVVEDIEPPDYRVPFEEDADRDPTLSEITRIVCHDKIRPMLANQIVKNGQMADVSRLIKECMVERPEARINTLRLRKTVGDLVSQCRS